MNEQTEAIEDMLREETIENLLMIAALGQGTLKSLARQELKIRQCLSDTVDLSEAFMTNLCVF